MSCYNSGVYIINLKRTWEKLLLAARAIVAIENPADICVISSRNTGQVRLTWSVHLRLTWYTLNCRLSGALGLYIKHE